MANYISQHTGAQIDNGVAKANSAVQPSDLTTAIANKQDNLVSGTNIKSLNSTTLLGTGNIDINKTTLGLNNVDNTADLAKPISTATQTALNGKAASVHTHATTDVSGLDTALSGKAASVHNHVTSDVTGLDTALNAKVDKEAGKGLSSSDYTSTEKTKLAGIADNANNYTHPASHPASVITQDENNRLVTDVEKAAWNAKQAALVSGTNLKTVNGQSLLGEGDLPIGAGGAWADITGKPAVIAAGDDAATARTAIGLGSVDNTSDAGKPVSTAQAIAIGLKQDTLISGTNIMTLNGVSILNAGNLQVGGGIGAATTLFLNNSAAFADNFTLTPTPTGLPETNKSAVCNSGVNGGVGFIERYVSDPLGGLSIEGGIWRFNTYASTTSNTGLNRVITRVNKRSEVVGVTVTMTGAGLTRTLTATGGTPFIAGHATASVLTAALVELPTQTAWVSGYTSPTQVTITLTDSGFGNVTGVSLNAIYTKLFSVTTGDITGATPALYLVESTQTAFACVPSDRLVLAYFGVTDSGTNRSIGIYYDGQTHYSNTETPIAQRHNRLGGLNEGEYLHLSSADKTKLDGIEVGANNYTHPASHPASIITQDASNRFVTDAEKATWNSNVAEHEAAVDPHPQYKVTPTLDAPLSFTYTGTLAAAPTAYQTAPMLPAPSGKEWVGWVSMAQIGTGVSGITFPNLEGVVSTFNPSNMAALTSLSLPALTTVGGAFAPSSMTALTSLSLPALTTVGTTFSPNNMAALTSLSLPALTTVGTSFNPSSMAALTSLSLPAIERIGTNLASGDVINISAAVGALTSFTLPATLKQVGGTGGNVTITSAALDQTSVDSILVRLAALDGTNGTTAFNNRTVTITGTSAAPSATGLAAKATLVARGCNVTHK